MPISSMSPWLAFSISSLSTIGFTLSSGFFSIRTQIKNARKKLSAKTILTHIPEEVVSLSSFTKATATGGKGRFWTLAYMFIVVITFILSFISFNPGSIFGVFAGAIIGVICYKWMVEPTVVNKLTERQHQTVPHALREIGISICISRKETAFSRNLLSSFSHFLF